MTPNATDQVATANTPNATSKDTGGEMWGWPLEFWDKIVFWSLVVTAIAGALSVTTGFAAGLLAYWTGAVEKQEFDKQLTESKVEIEKARASAADANRVAAEATERANKAALELEKYRAPRRLPANLAAQLSKELEVFRGTPFAIAVPGGNREAEVFAEQIETILLQANWTQLDWAGVIVLKRSDKNKKQWGSVSTTGVLLAVDEKSKGTLEKATFALGTGLKNTGYDVTATIQSVEDQKMEGAIRIVVGQKP